MHWYCLQSHMTRHEKESIHPNTLYPNISSLEDETKSSFFIICNQKKNQTFTFCCNTSWTKFQSNLQRKEILVIFNDCQDMLQNFDEIISQPFPVNRLFNQILTNIEVGFILQPFLIEQLGFMKLVLNCIQEIIWTTEQS